MPHNHGVKLHSISLNSLQILAYMVECTHLIVNDSQIKVNDLFLDF
jgi:hypothetical protein